MRWVLEMVTKQIWVEQVLRLQKVFPNKYAEERSTQLWSRVSELDEVWLRRIVSTAIETLKDINWPEEIAKQIERHSQAFKRRREFLEPEQQTTSVFAPDEIKQHFKFMRARLAGHVGEEETKIYLDCLRSAISESKQNQCKRCEAHPGYIFERDAEGYEFAHKCRCLKGQQRPEHFSYR